MQFLSIEGRCTTFKSFPGRLKSPVSPIPIVSEPADTCKEEVTRGECFGETTPEARSFVTDPVEMLVSKHVFLAHQESKESGFEIQPAWSWNISRDLSSWRFDFFFD